ncbi:uncharacterized protein LOC112506170 [Cynara cardunculus var. scolymus]|uniref:uncharacterized protein LOC112506170 n=1 Tax=Cynara cardunculus var. scolymus TaxID=59895 RepID=UPI000D62F22A|nr:uncharacterized protein LOC112506170 [Cynara cardunculus var. scolymus]
MKDTIGALDGTLIHAVVPASQQTAYRGRGGGQCYQNVLGICDFNVIFAFVWPGWEDIAHDSRVLTEVAFNPSSGFLFPPEDQLFMEYNEDTIFTNEEENVGSREAELDGSQWGVNSTQYMANLCDQIANGLVSNV